MTKALAISAQDAASIWQEQNKLAEVKKIYGKDLTDSEFSILVQIGQATHLNPFLREIWAVKYGTNPAQIFIGRDGYRKAAQSNPDYDYHLADAVYQNDDFKIEDGEVRHTYSGKDRGALVGAYCVVKRKSSTKTMFNFVDIKEYTTGKSLWIGKPATMIKKVAEAQGLRMAFQQLFAEPTTKPKHGKNQPNHYLNLKKKSASNRKRVKRFLPHGANSGTCTSRNTQTNAPIRAN
ncbi:phage recombination protein Bet [Candidatus Peregrinibacteria bacterium]|nr:MAG: phage recombination protein Bet [Candidatus Peregrinibacteria bacterium]